MMTDTIQRQYNEVIASHYDLDPQSVTGDTLDRAAERIRKQMLPDGPAGRFAFTMSAWGRACSSPACGR